MNLDYPRWAVPAEAFAPGAAKVWRHKLGLAVTGKWARS